MTDPRDARYRAMQQAKAAYQEALDIQVRIQAVAEATDFLVDDRRTAFDQAVLAWGDAKLAAAFEPRSEVREARSERGAALTPHSSPLTSPTNSGGQS